jgi:NADH:ubiquinone oxidoreductase subunit K
VAFTVGLGTIAFTIDLGTIAFKIGLVGFVTRRN